MNEKLNSIFMRRSIRRYTPDEVSDDMVKDLLEAAMAAPSACGKDPWDFIVVRDAGKKREIAAGLPHGKISADAPVAIVVCGDLLRAHDQALSFMLQDCSAAIQNLLLAAANLGLGACWLGAHPREERVIHLQHLFGLPDTIIPIAVISVGWPKDRAQPRTRYHEERVHKGEWTGRH